MRRRIHEDLREERKKRKGKRLKEGGRAGGAGAEAGAGAEGEKEEEEEKEKEEEQEEQEQKQEQEEAGRGGGKVNGGPPSRLELIPPKAPLQCKEQRYHRVPF